MSDYTPTTERVRNSYANDIACFPKPENVFEANARAEAAKEEFDRWLAEHDRELQAEAWDEGKRDQLNTQEVALPRGVTIPLAVNPYREESK